MKKMNLTKEEIQFIDNYLQQADVKHLDIRLEMIDHVSTAIETNMANGDARNFYYVFKDFMVENKQGLLNNNDFFLKQTSKNLSNQLLNAFFSLKSLALASLITFLVYFGFENFDINYSINITFTITAILVIIPGISYFIALKAYNYERFSGVERLSFYVIFCIQLLNVLNISSTGFYVKYIGVLGLSIVIALVLTFLLVFIKVSIGVFKHYKNRYQYFV